MHQQPPMQPQARLSSAPNFHHQHAPQMGPSVGFQHPGAQHLSQPMFHSGNRPPSLGPSFPQGQPPRANQLPAQLTYQNQSFSSPLNQVQSRIWLMHWSLFIFFNHDNGRTQIIDLFNQDKEEVDELCRTLEEKEDSSCTASDQFSCITI